jgi:hypothetical protein
MARLKVTLWRGGGASTDDDLDLDMDVLIREGLVCYHDDHDVLDTRGDHDHDHDRPRPFWAMSGPQTGLVFRARGDGVDSGSFGVASCWSVRCLHGAGEWTGF